MRISALDSSSEEKSFTGQGEEALWANFSLPTRALRVWADCLVLLTNRWGESADKSMEELLELDEEKLSDGSWVAKLLGF